MADTHIFAGQPPSGGQSDGGQSDGGQSDGGQIVIRNSGGWLFAPGSTANFPYLSGNLEGWAQIFPPDATLTPVVTGGSFPDAGWDPLLKAGVIAGKFAKLAEWGDLDPGPPKAMTNQVALDADLKALLAHVKDPEVDGMRAEIVAQSDVFSQYFARLCACSPEFRPATYGLIMIGIQVGGLVAATFKMKYMRPRPGQIWPALSPIIATPRHPSYPSGHALQAFTVANCLTSARKPMAPLLLTLAERIATNRERARVHYPSDTAASRHIQHKVMAVLEQVTEYKAVLKAAIAER